MDMDEEKQLLAFEMASKAVDRKCSEKVIASLIKQEFDKRYNPYWHCVVGEKFGSSVRFEEGHFIYFYAGATAILLFKCG